MTTQNVEESKPTTTNDQIDMVDKKLEELSIVAAESRTTSESVDKKCDVASVDSVADQKLSDVVIVAATSKHSVARMLRRSQT